MKRGVLVWIKHRLGINDDPEPSAHLNAALKESDELSDTKQVMARFSRDLESGHVRGPEKVLHIRQSDFLDDELFNSPGLRKEKRHE